ncbi:hypothetical protein HPB50_001112 [Hyalomma asiaticum]|uniref:Uncharacterized protein n=1 Tax=Hyalomma asiaticum TaxID=266040 RepID=A0ACB7RZL7_HYAAI|nr:hypothetical protein HPB50_001112 [Hyalomma asiaticum]
MGAAHLSKEATKATTRLQPTWNLNTGAYETLMPWIRAENLKALNAVLFSQPHAMGVGIEPQYLDIGCGPGSFTKEALLPGVRPACNRLVAVDRCSRVLDYARENFSHRCIVYDVMDIERDDPECLMERYGGFNRVYSFLTFHYVVDIAKAYDNIRKLLKRGGECLVLSITISTP